MNSQPGASESTGQLVLGVRHRPSPACCSRSTTCTSCTPAITCGSGPWCLIAICLVHVSQAKTAAGTIGGGLWILAGTVLIGNRLGLFHANIWNFLAR